MTDKKKLLIVDDNKELCDVLVDKFTSEGLEVFCAYDGEEGITMSLEQHPDLILLDIRMPNVDGWEMLERLREDEWGSGVDVIMLTAAGDMESISKAVDRGTYEYIIKTESDIDDIARKVNEKLGI